MAGLSLLSLHCGNHSNDIFGDTQVDRKPALNGDYRVNSGEIHADDRTEITLFYDCYMWKPPEFMWK